MGSVSPPSLSLPLEGMKRKIMRNLRTLEQEGMVNSKNDYQEIINAIAKVYTRTPLATMKGNATGRWFQKSHPQSADRYLWVKQETNGAQTHTVANAGI